MFEFAKFCQLFKTRERSTFEVDFKPDLGHMFKLKVLWQLERLGNQIKSFLAKKYSLSTNITMKACCTNPHHVSTTTVWSWLIFHVIVIIAILSFQINNK